MHHWYTYADAGTIARVCSLPAVVVFVLVCGYITERLREPRPMPSNAIDSSTYKPPTHVVHVIDFDRSHVSICQDETILARCCVQGCDVTVKIGRDIIGLVVSSSARPSSTEP